MDIQELSIGGEHFADIHGKVRRNADLAVFYDNLHLETFATKYSTRASAIRLCCQWWDTDYYRIQGVKDIKRVNLCKDKFCYNCQSMLAIKRQSKYAPKLDAVYDDYTMCHMVVTVPNVYADELFATVGKMYSRFKHLTRYLSGNAHIRGMDFEPYGYAGGVRALEVTYNRTECTYHPHFHVILLLRKGITFSGRHINQYSFDRKRPNDPPRPYSDFEIVLQKIWYLLMNGETVTKEAVEAVNVGYDIHIDKIAKGDYHEVFKYACKGAFDVEEGEYIYNERVFRVLLQALENRRMIQGYGVLHNFKDEAGEILEEDLTANYEEMVAALRAFEEPVFKVESLQEILREENCKYVSRSNLKKLLIERRRSERETV